MAFLATVATLFTSTASFQVHASGPFGETYSFSQSASRIQETDSPGITFVLNVTTPLPPTTYQFSWAVTDPTGAITTTTTAVNAAPATFATSVTYPTDFGKNITYVGEYNITVSQTIPPPTTRAATSLFQVGLTDAKEYQRTQPVSMIAQGYKSTENITISIRSPTGNAPGFPTTRLANSLGVFAYTWTSIPLSVPVGNYTVTLTGSSTPKTGFPDTQTFLVDPANVTITQLTISQSSLQRSQTETFRFSSTYPNTAQAKTGTAIIRIIEADGFTEHDITATYKTSLGQFQETFQIPLSSGTGVWVASIDVGGYNDGYGNIGPSSSVNRGFAVSSGILTVTASTLYGNYTTGSIVVINAIVVSRGGDNFTSGTVIATTHHSSLQVGSPLQLSYDQTHAKWVGSYTVNSTRPVGLWLSQVNPPDAYGNSGYGSTSTLVTLPPSQLPPPSPTSSTFNDLWIIVIALVAALAILASFIVYRRGRMVRKVLKVDLEAIHAEAKKVENNEFFKNVQDQLKEQRKNPRDSTDTT